MQFYFTFLFDKVYIFTIILNDTFFINLYVKRLHRYDSDYSTIILSSFKIVLIIIHTNGISTTSHNFLATMRQFIFLSNACK